MKASRVHIIPKMVKGVTKNGRRHLNSNNEPKNIDKSNKNQTLSPSCNLENISPISKSRRKGGNEKQITPAVASPQAPKTKNNLSDSILDTSVATVSEMKKSKKRRKTVTTEKKIPSNELSLSENEISSINQLEESFKTPNTSTIAANEESSGKSDRQLRSSGRKKAASIFDTPSKSDKTNEHLIEVLEASELNKITEQNRVSKKLKGRKLLSPSEEVKSIESESVDEENQLDSSQEASKIDTAESTKILSSNDSEKVYEMKNSSPAVDEEEVVQLSEEQAKPQQKLVDQGIERNEAEALPVTVEEVQKNEVKEDEILPSVDNAALLAIDNIKSPSGVSVDSAKGSSIGTDAEYPIYVVGDLFWGQIHTYCYWPCIVCPDVSSDTNRITRFINQQQMEVHVRFFADNARHSWVKRENLLPYLGLKQYKELTNEAKEKYGENSPKCKIFFPKKSKKDIWRSAVKEADQLVNVAYEERLKAFFELNDFARERLKEEKLRRKSLNLSKSSLNISLLSSMDTTADSTSEAARKRNRSESPTSPEFSPIRKNAIKRRKTTSTMERNEYMISRRIVNMNDIEDSISDALPSTSHNAQQELQRYNDETSPTELTERQGRQSPEFESLYKMLKDYITSNTKCEPEIESGIYRAVANVWAMKKLVDERNAKNGLLAPTPNAINNGHKRLSLRLLDMQQQRQIMTSSLSTSPKLIAVKSMSSMLQVTHPPPPSAEEKRRSGITAGSSKTKTRPMFEVIDDIFNLENSYLFENVPGRAPVCKYCFKPGGKIQRCAKGCFSWLHADCNAIAVDKTNEEAAIGHKKRSMKRRKSSLKLVESTTNIIHITGDDEAQKNSVIMPHDKDISNINQEKRVDEEQQKADETSLLRTEMEMKKDSDETDLESPIICKECANDMKPQCFVCQSEKMIKSNQNQTVAESSTSTTTNDTFVKEEIHMCNMANCGRSYHLSCLKYWPQAKPILNNRNAVVSLRCPSHICHTCVSDDPKGKFQHLKDANTTKCVKCPATYHMDSTCIPAGSQILTAAHIICPRHGMLKSDQNVNVIWCFICVRGGNLLCCETCPTAVHAECTNVQLEPNENYICDECESGRLPLYGEMVWAKFNMYRWWPAIILPPTEVPLNIRNKTHNPFDFVIRFFGTHDHGWISRRRVYLYVEGDWSEPPKSRRPMEQSYLRGVFEAKEAYEIIKAKTLARDTDNKNKDRLHPHPYVKIRVNRAVPPVKLNQDIEMASKCGCDPQCENPCGLDSDCLNRALYHECNPKVCPAGERCQNQMFESRVSPALEIFYAKKERGFGLRCREAIPTGAFVIEYVGEVINSEEFQRRMQQKSANRDENYYFLYVEKDYIIDAGPKGNMARFMNHSCDPNCETQKWSVNGLNRVGLFAIKDIPMNTELTFNYHWDELLGNDKKICCCGSVNCTGQIGKISKEETKRKQKNEETSNVSKNVQGAKSKKSKKRRFVLQLKNKRRTKSAIHLPATNTFSGTTTTTTTASTSAKKLRKSAKSPKQPQKSATIANGEGEETIGNEESQKIAQPNDDNNNNNN